MIVENMENKNVSARNAELSLQQELPNHYAYIYKFRVEQCPLFLQHKCTQHRPFICFHWHFQNQRRRKPIRKRDGTLNYSADEYCTKYDETTGLCPDGEECPFLHRTAGDTERRYHLRYYKTAPCVHETDSRGFCAKNGVHCAFAHGNTDLRNPVYDIRDLRAKENADMELCGLNALDKERNLLNDDPKWQDTNYVLTNYKTELCKKPPRLCRQGYACPQYHNSRDRRRSPKKFKYRSTPCPNAKHGEEWGDPTGCESGDACQYCHTRTEQQFHPEIYKSTKCHDMQTNSYCPRGSFCAFAHGDFEIVRESGQEGGTSLADLVSGALPHSGPKSFGKESSLNGITGGDMAFGSPASPPGFNGKVSSSVPIHTPYNRLQSLETGDGVLASSGPTGVIGSSLGGFGPLVQPISKPRSFSVPAAELSASGLDRMISLDRDDWDPVSNTEQADSRNRKTSLYGSGTFGNFISNMQATAYFTTNSRLNNTNMDQMMGSTVDETEESFKDNSREYEAGQPSLCGAITMGCASSGLLSGSAPVNIPRKNLALSGERRSLRLTPSPPTLLSGIKMNGADLETDLANHTNSLYLNRIGSLGNNGGGFLDWGNHQTSPNNGGRVFSGPGIANSPMLGTSGLLAHNEVLRLRDEAANNQAKVVSLEEELLQARKAIDAWRCKALVAEQQRDEAVTRMVNLQSEMKMLRDSMSGHGHQITGVEELRNMTL